jgi:hypothetical protein
MILVTSQYDTLFESVEIPRGVRCVMPPGTDGGIRRMHAELGLAAPRVSRLGHYTRPYCGQDLDGKRLLAWRGTGVGDQLVFAGLLGILKRRWPSCEISFAVDGQRYDWLWHQAENLPFTARRLPIPFDAWKRHDYHLIGLGLVEDDHEPDQPDIWTGHLQFAGLDPATVPAGERLPVVPICDRDRCDAHDRLDELGIGAGRRVVVWQVASSTPVRSYAPRETAVALRRLARELPNDCAIIASGTRRAGGAYEAAQRVRGVHWIDSWPIRSVFALVERAACVVAPDSCLGHAAGGLAVPCVSLWSSFLPADRVATYASHRPIVGEIECSPCRHHEKGSRLHGCPLAGKRNRGVWCAGLRRIEPEKIVAKVMEVMENVSGT